MRLLLDRCRPGVSLRRPVIALFACLAILVNALPPARAQSTDDYRLGILDKLNIRIAEWQAAEGTFRDWSSVSGEYTVGPNGAISLPFVGPVPAQGKTTEELAETIGDQLQQRLGLADRPSASVEIVEFRPVFLTGDVETPGKYAFLPGLTVLKAVSLAGGLRRGSDNSRAARDFIQAKGDYDVLIAERNRLLARKARLQAESTDKSKLTTPEELKGNPRAEELMANEAALMEARNRRHDLQLKALHDLKDLLQSEIASLGKKSDTQEEQLALMEEQLKGIGNLADKGLVVNSRVLGLQQQIADLQGRLLDIDTTTLQAKQDINKATQDEIALENDRDAELAQTRQDTQDQLKETALKLATNRELMLEAVLQSASAAANSSADDEPVVAYTIVRQGPDGPKEIKADENTPVLPGDVIKTKLELSIAPGG